MSNLIEASKLGCIRQKNVLNKYPYYTFRWAFSIDLISKDKRRLDFCL